MTTNNENESPVSPKIDNLNHNFNPKMLKLEYGRICKRYDILCNSHRELEKSYRGECAKTTDLSLELVSLKSSEFVLSDKKTTQTDTNDPDDLLWWKDNDAHLNKVELQAYVELVNQNNVLINELKTENCNLKKQHRYIEFKNNLIEKKLKFRDGTLEMIKSTISGETNVVHPDYKNTDNTDKVPTLTEKCMAFAKKRSELRNKLNVTCENNINNIKDVPIIELKNPLEVHLPYESNVNSKTDISEVLKPNVNLEIIEESSKESLLSDDSDDDSDDYSDDESDDGSYSYLDDVDESPDESMADLIWAKDPVTPEVVLTSPVPDKENIQPNTVEVKKVDNTCVYVDPESLQNCYYTPAVFKSVFPQTHEYVFRNSCLGILHGSVPSTALWDADTCKFDINYWDGFDENQSHQIVYSLWNNYSNYYSDLKNRITTLQDNIPYEYSNNNQSYKYILKDIVYWLFE